MIQLSIFQTFSHWEKAKDVNSSRIFYLKDDILELRLKYQIHQSRFGFVQKLLNLSLWSFQTFDVLFGLMLQKITDWIIKVEPVIIEQSLNWLIRLFESFQRFVSFQFLQLIFKNIDTLLNFLFPLWKLLTFEEKYFIELQWARRENKRFLFILKKQHQSLLIILPNLIERQSLVIDLFRKVL